MAKKILLTFLLLFFLSTNIVLAQTATPSATPNNQREVIYNQERMDRIENQLNFYRDENYQKAIQAAIDARDGANQVVDWFIKLATILGFIIVFAAIVIGWDWRSFRRELGKHVRSAKANSEIVSKIADEAVSKKKNLDKEAKKLTKLKEEFTEVKVKGQEDITELKEKIDTALQKVQGTVSDIEVLKNSANFISNATQYPGTNLSTGFFTVSSSGSRPVSYGVEHKLCNMCGVPKPPSDFPISLAGTLGIGNQTCNDCLLRAGQS